MHLPVPVLNLPDPALFPLHFLVLLGAFKSFYLLSGEFSCLILILGWRDTLNKDKLMLTEFDSIALALAIIGVQRRLSFSSLAPFFNNYRILLSSIEDD
jgi:hypothetical protein